MMKIKNIDLYQICDNPNDFVVDYIIQNIKHAEGERHINFYKTSLFRNTNTRILTMFPDIKDIIKIHLKPSFYSLCGNSNDIIVDLFLESDNIFENINIGKNKNKRLFDKFLPKLINIKECNIVKIYTLILSNPNIFRNLNYKEISKKYFI